MILYFLDIYHDSCETSEIPRIKGGIFSMPLNDSCLVLPWAEKAKRNCVVSYHCLDIATNPIPKTAQCLKGAWNYSGPYPECKGRHILILFVGNVSQDLKYYKPV
jgi:hypothetical protein